MQLLEQTTDQDLNSLILELERDESKRPGQTLVCVVCGAQITDEIFRTGVRGQHRYCRINPQGIAYDFSLFSDAPGCARVGVATLEATWFAGFAWRLALCGRCAEHLGWYFARGGHDAFFGLITGKLRPGPAA